MTTTKTKVIELYLKGYTSADIITKLDVDKSFVNKVVLEMTEQYYRTLELQHRERVAQAGNMERFLFDNIRKLSESEYQEQKNLVARFCV